MSANVHKLLKRCFPLIPQHGFTRKTIALASTYDKFNNKSVARQDAAETAQDEGMAGNAEGAPLSETAISALFGSADGARRTLINAWLATATEDMGTPWKLAPREESRTPPPLIDLLQKRLELNKPVLNHLPEAFALLCSSPPPASVSAAIAQPNLPFPLPIFFPFPNPLPLLEHAYKVADEALVISTPTNKHSSDNWYANRVAVGSIYIAAELHQMTSPHSAPYFLNDLLSTRESIERGIGEVGLFADYVLRSLKGIAKSGGAF